MPVVSKKRKNNYPKGIFRKIFVSARRELSPFGIVFVYPPENFDESQLGTILGIIKISDNSEESSFIANLLASIIRKEYFSKPSRSALESFEASLRKANLALAELARQGNIKWIGNINFAGGVFEKNNLHFSKVGTSSILLLRGGMIANISAGIGDASMDSNSHPLKTFTDISSGKIESGDCFIFATSDLLEIFSLDEIRQNAARFSREEFPDILSTSLSSNSELSGAIVANIVPPSENTEQKIKKVQKSYILEKIPAHQTDHHASHAVEKKLSTEKIHSVSNHCQVYSHSASDIKSEKDLYISEFDEVIPEESLREKIFFSTEKFFSQIKNFFSFAIKKTAYFFKRIDQQKIIDAIRSIIVSVNSIRKIDWQKKNIRLLIASIGLIVLVIFFSLFAKSIIKKNSTSSQPAITTEQTNSLTNILNDVNIKNAENVSEIASLPTDSREISLMNGILYVLAENTSILEINPTNGEIKKIDSSITAEKFQLAAEMPDLHTIFILTTGKKLVSFTPFNKKFQENNISLPNNINAADMKTYLTYIYFLDSDMGQIYRYPRVEGGFGNQQSWIKTGLDVKNSVSFAINGDLFTASRNQLTAYFQGKKDEKINFENPIIPFAIEKIFTAPDFQNIYVLDNKNHRIAVYSKDGKIITQYWNSSIYGIKDFTVDEKNKIIYLQKDDSILKFSAN